MGVYQKLKRTDTSSINYKLRFMEQFPELSRVGREELDSKFTNLGLDFYAEEEVPVTTLTRLTLPFAVILYALMFIFIPIKFLITGTWRYSLNKSNPRILNWFRSLGLM